MAFLECSVSMNNNNKSGYALLLHCIGLPLAYSF